MKRKLLLPIAAVLFMGILSCDQEKEEKFYLGHEYVDLGLSVKWATCNVGATTLEEYGDYFAWGEKETYYQPGSYAQGTNLEWKYGKSAGYGLSNYKYCNGSRSTMTKYCNKSSYGNNGFIDNKTTLDPDDDVAHVIWGGNWRMPTDDEFTELQNNCTWTWTTQNGVYGYKVTSKKTGYTDRSIFLPAAGYRYDTSLRGVGSGGFYWSSSLCMNGPSSAWNLDFSSSDYRGMRSLSRENGLSVRPVCQ